MKHGIIHFSQTIHRNAKEIGAAADSGNGYYSYSYTDTPYTGDADSEEARRNIYKAVRNRWYKGYSIFTSCGSVEILPSDAKTGGIIRVQHIYHHGD
jgi:hypothetical protein